MYSHRAHDIHVGSLLYSRMATPFPWQSKKKDIWDKLASNYRGLLCAADTKHYVSGMNVVCTRVRGSTEPAYNNACLLLSF